MRYVRFINDRQAWVWHMEEKRWVLYTKPEEKS